MDRVWSIFITKDPKTWEDEVFLMTAYYISNLLVENIDPIEPIKLEEKNYLIERMKQIRNVLAAMAQSRI